MTSASAAKRLHVIQLVSIAVGIALVAGELWRGGSVWTAPLLAVSFAALALIPLRLPRGSLVTSVGGLVTAAAVLSTPLGAAGAFFLGDTLGAVARGNGEGTRPGVLRFVRALLVAGAAVLYTRSLPYVVVAGTAYRVALAAVATGLAFTLFDLLLSTLGDTEQVLTGPPGAFANLLSLLGWGYVAQVSVGAALALVYPQLDLVAYLVLVPLMMIMSNTHAQLIRVKAAYLRTVGALARAAEMQDVSRRGHSERTARIAVLVGRGLGLDSRALERLALAALLHDIGLVGVESDRGPVDPWRVATQGAELIARVSFLASLAPILRKQPIPYAEYVDTRDADGLLSRVIRAASDYDSLTVARGPDGFASADAVCAVLTDAAGGEYDPRVVSELVRMAARGELPTA